MAHGHEHGHSADADRRWLAAALATVLVFMVGEVVAGLLAHSLALLSDAAHMLTDAGALTVAIVAARVARRPARGAFTFGFARVDALSGQASGITLVLLAIFVAVEAVRRLVDPGPVEGGVVTVVALAGVVVNLVATGFASRADRSSLNVRGVMAHLVTDLWAFGATLVAGLVVVTTGFDRADPIASLAVVAVMAWSGTRLVRQAGRVFLEAAPHGIDPHGIGEELVAVPGVAEVHDLHVWEIGPGTAALSAHVLVRDSHDCHEVAGRLRLALHDGHGIDHVTLQTDHVASADTCTDAHGTVHVSPVPPAPPMR